MTAVKYRRVLLKLCGEAFKGKTAYGIDALTVAGVAGQIKQMVDMGVGGIITNYPDRLNRVLEEG